MEARKHYARSEKQHQGYKLLINGLLEAQRMVEKCEAVKKALKLGSGGWYGVPELTLEQSYGRLDTYIKL